VASTPRAARMPGGLKSHGTWTASVDGAIVICVSLAGRHGYAAAPNTVRPPDSSSVPDFRCRRRGELGDRVLFLDPSLSKSRAQNSSGHRPVAAERTSGEPTEGHGRLGKTGRMAAPPLSGLRSGRLRNGGLGSGGLRPGRRADAKGSRVSGGPTSLGRLGVGVLPHHA
jgi:hypothetical protein